MNKMLLEIRDLNKSYGEQKVLCDFSLSVRQGESIAIVGPSGSGKSTLLHIIGLLDTPDSGEIELFGARYKNLNDEKKTKLRRDEIAFVYQFHYLINELTALENITLAYRIKYGCDPEDADLRIMKGLGIYEKMSSYPGQLSGGERQRVAICRALVTSPKLLLADEPTGNLDKTNAAKVRDDFMRIVAERGTTLILSTHDEDLAMHCDRKVLLK